MLKSLHDKFRKQQNASKKDVLKNSNNKNDSLNLSLNDCMCPICLEIFIEPVRMPCKHEICLNCFETMLDKTNLCCPMCRLRISTWARQATNNNTLVDTKRWQSIQNKFPDEIDKRLTGKSREDVENTLGKSLQASKQDIHFAHDGEIRREFLDFMKREEERIRLEKENEEMLSRAVIEQVIQNENALSLTDYIEREQQHVGAHVHVTPVLPSGATVSRTNSLRPRRQKPVGLTGAPQPLGECTQHIVNVNSSTPNQRPNATINKRRLSNATNNGESHATDETRSAVVTRSQSMRLSSRPQVNLNKTHNFQTNTTPIIELNTSNENNDESTGDSIGLRITRRGTKRLKR